jgi:3-hydroxy-9,10-secoandrosta-1,3,5(10)-triene-9,17-dione monooxygenase reductase component
MTIHSSHPFASPEEDRSPVRRLRGRLAAPVTLWTAPGPAGLTVSSALVADGEPALVLGVLDDESQLWDAIERERRFTVAPLRAADQQLADRFAGLMPAPGGLFRSDEWLDTDYGPVLAGLGTWAGCRLTEARPCGWGLLVEATVEHIEVGPDLDPLVHHRGRYRQLR